MDADLTADVTDVHLVWQVTVTAREEIDSENYEQSFSSLGFFVRIYIVVFTIITIDNSLIIVGHFLKTQKQTRTPIIPYIYKSKSF